MVNGNLTDWYSMPNSYGVNGTQEVTGLGSFVQWASFTVGDYLGYGIIAILWLSIFGISMASGSRKAMLTASFITFIFSIYLLRMGILNPIVCILLIIATIIGAIGAKEDHGY